MAQNKVTTDLTANNKDLDEGLQNGVSSIRNFATTAAGIAGGIAIFAGIKKAAQELIELGKESVSLFQVQEDAEARLNAMLQATGRAASISMREIKEFASSRQLVTTFGDEVTIEAAAALTKFESISSDIFLDALATAQDMAAATGQSLTGSVNMIGRALADPRSGIQLLRRSLGGLDADTQSAIQSLIDIGDTAGAQEAIFRVLEQRFDGLAETMAQTTSGAVQQLQNAFGDLKEEIGRGVVLGFFDTWKEASNDVLGASEEQLDNILLTTIVIGQVAGDIVNVWIDWAKSLGGAAVALSDLVDDLFDFEDGNFVAQGIQAYIDDAREMLAEARQYDEEQRQQEAAIIESVFSEGAEKAANAFKASITDASSVFQRIQQGAATDPVVDAVDGLKNGVVSLEMIQKEQLAAVKAQNQLLQDNLATAGNMVE